MTTPDVQFERGLPASLDAERSILGALLLENKSYNECAGKIEAEDFALDSHRRIFKRMEEILLKNRAMDIVTLSEEMARHKEIEAIGGVSYLASLTEGLPRRISIDEYVRIVKDKSLLRQAIAAGSRLITIAADQSEDASEILQEFHETSLLLSEKSISQGLETFGTFVNRTYPNIEALYEQTALAEGLDTGFGEFDDMTCGLQKKDLILIAARPSMGKTALMCNMIRDQAIRQRKVIALFSLEMKKKAILDRLQSDIAMVLLEEIRKGSLTPVARRYMDDALSLIKKSPIYIDDTPAQTMPQMQAKASLLKQQIGLDAVYIDQLSHVTLAKVERGMNREQQVAQISKQAKRMAYALDVPVVLLHQLNRNAPGRSDKRPQLSDLRESGSLEQDADVVAFIHRESYYDQKDESLKGRAELILAKQRQGRIGTIDLLEALEYQRFTTHPNWEEKQRQKGMF